MILFVRLWWSATQAQLSGGLFWRNEEAWGARWISCFWDLSERNAAMHSKANESIHCSGNLHRDICSRPLWPPYYTVCDFIYLLHPTTSKEDFDIIIHRASSPIIEVLESSTWCQYLLARGWYSYLLPAQLIVHLYPLHFLQTLLQSLVALPQLADVVARFRQDASFALEGQRWLVTV